LHRISMKHFNIKTLGCKVNQSESETLAAQLQQKGMIDFTDNQSGEKADLYIINTCAITGKAAMQSRQAIRKALKENPQAKIIVTGCYAQTSPDEIKTINGVDCILGHNEKQNIINMVVSGETVCQWHEQKNISMPTAPFKKTRPFLKVQDGCNSFCTYCIVPFARGRSKSLATENVLEHIRQYVAAGYHELVLTGVHLGMYGLDLSPKTNLYELLTQINNATDVYRIRLSSIEPLELTDNIIGLVSFSDKFCNHFHIPLQSGDDPILKKMNRPYSSSFFRKQVLKIKSLIPDAAIGADVLIGFPGETDKAFNHTLSLIDELPLTYLHVFPFSPRKGTPAARFPGQIRREVIKERCKIIRTLSTAKKRTFYTSFIGRTVTALMESKRTGTGHLKGITSNYIPILIEGKDDLKNTLVKVNLQQLTTDHQMLAQYTGTP
jgi:threonylcarbamoyladenosine tRNA methylthiotransferase MtaB